MPLLEMLILGLYFGVLAVLSVFGLHRSAMVFLHHRHRRAKARPAPLPTSLPRVTLQLPVYNEMYVVDRLLDSVSRLRYPRELLDVQVLDDSTDETQAVAARGVVQLQELGFDASHVRRGEREGFKAGALAHGLRTAKGELIAIFDADFVIPPEFLEQLVGHFDDPKVGMVQARWGHLNRDHSELTRVQALLLDGHFVLEHGGRHRSGRFFNFNGTAGLWRRVAIEAAGGWQPDTLTEDLDLSYRAQAEGWKFVFVPDLVSPAELPVEMNSFKTQQHRWSKGSIQTGLKLLPRLLRSNLPAKVKLEAAFHLSANLAYPLMLVLSLLLLPALVIRSERGLEQSASADLWLFLSSTVSVCGFSLASQREIDRDGWLRQARHLPAVLALGVGLSVNNARAVIEALFGRPTGFVRTPKFRVEGADREWRRKKYRGDQSSSLGWELALSLYCLATAAFAATHELWASLPFAVLFCAGYAWTGLSSLRECLPVAEIREAEASGVSP